MEVSKARLVNTTLLPGLNFVGHQLLLWIVDWKASSLLFPLVHFSKAISIWFDVLKSCSELKVDFWDEMFSAERGTWTEAWVQMNFQGLGSLKKLLHSQKWLPWFCISLTFAPTKGNSRDVISFAIFFMVVTWLFWTGCWLPNFRHSISLRLKSRH